MKPTTFIFDMDDVLCRYDKPKRIAYLAEISGVAPQDVQERIWGSGFEDDADMGVYPDGESYLAAFADKLGYPLTRQQWIDARVHCMTPDPEMLDIVAKLKQQGRVAILTNNVPLLQDTLDEVFPAVHTMFGQHIFFSCSLRLGKPDPQIYHAVAGLLGVAASACLFADDKLANAEGATKAGMTGVHFTDAIAFADKLRELGVVV